MGEGLLVNTVHSSSTHIPGRALNSAGVHHFIIDGSTAPKEELTPIDVFLAGISSCGVHLIERFADDAGVALRRVEADIEATRSPDDLARFASVTLAFHLMGPNQEQAEELIERFKGR